MNKAKTQTNEFIIELKLAINQRLFEKDLISEEMYLKAKEMILIDNTSDEKYNNT